jgi:5-methylcytosine-specific restriction endonuclease McrA
MLERTRIVCLLTSFENGFISSKRRRLAHKMPRKVTASQKKQVAGRQRFTCAGNVEGYTCPLQGKPFDESGYEIDHIRELRNGGTDDMENLQALCLMCHRVKTNRNSRKETKPVVEEKVPSVIPLEKLKQIKKKQAWSIENTEIGWLYSGHKF